MSKSIVLEKAFAFALRIARLHRYLVEERISLEQGVIDCRNAHRKTYKRSCGRRITSNIYYGNGVARRKASETQYWLQLLHFADFISENEYDSIETDREEIFRLLTSIVKTSKQNV